MRKAKADRQHNNNGDGREENSVYILRKTSVDTTGT